MRKVGAVLVILWIGLTFATGVGSLTHNQPFFVHADSDDYGPTIEWTGPDNSSDTLVLAWDGAYSGQTEEVWHLGAWVNDSDGVDTVIFMFRTILEPEWTNEFPLLLDGNDTLGYFQYNYTYAVWWNYTINRPQVEGTGGNFDFKIFANDTLGHSTETGVLTYSGGYLIVNPPPDVVFYSNLVPSLAAIGIVVVVLSVVIIFRRRS